MRLPDKPMVMGIVNVTPDSFSGDGVNVQAAIEQGLRMLEEGADILDIGGESTRPDAIPVSEQEELDRVLPVVDALRQQAEALISIDTMKARVAEECLNFGAAWINDVTGGRGDPAMLPLAARTDAPIVLMHNRASWQKAHGDVAARSFDAPEYTDFMAEILADMAGLKAAALAAGVKAENIILDPGLGFGKTVGQNCQIIRDIQAFTALGCPVLIGPSRKSFIGRVLGGLPPEERLEGTAAAVALSVANGARVVRVHDVRAMRRVVDMSWEIVK